MKVLLWPIVQSRSMTWSWHKSLQLSAGISIFCFQCKVLLLRLFDLHLLPSSSPASSPLSVSRFFFYLLSSLSPSLSKSFPYLSPSPSCSITPSDGHCWSLHVPDLTKQRRELVVTHAPWGEHLGVVVVEGAQLREAAQQPGELLGFLRVLQLAELPQHLQHGVLEPLHGLLIPHVGTLWGSKAKTSTQTLRQSYWRNYILLQSSTLRAIASWIHNVYVWSRMFSCFQYWICLVFIPLVLSQLTFLQEKLF